MDSRYRRILSMDEMYFQEESPIFLEKAALLFDQQKEINIFQGKFTNLQRIPVSAVYVDIVCCDISGKELGTVQGIYLDMNIPQNYSFGSNVPVEIPYADARKFAFTIAKIAYVNGNVEVPRILLHKIAQANELNSIKPFTEQYLREIRLLNESIVCKNLLTDEKSHWICPCGALNTKKERECRNCSLSYKRVIKLSDTSYLKQRKIEYEEKERQDNLIMQQKEETRIREAKIRNKKIAWLFSICVATIIFGYIIVNYLVMPQYYGNKAEKYISNKDYKSAERTYQKITNSIRKSKKIKGYYNSCIKFLSENDIENAEKCYDKFKGTKKTKDEKINNLWKKACIKEMKDNSDNMLLCYSHINNKEVLENKELNKAFMKYGKRLLINKDFNNAIQYFNNVSETYSVSLENTYYEGADKLIENGWYMEAIDNCFQHISQEHINELQDNLKNAYLSSINIATNINNLSKIKKYLSQDNMSSIKKTLYLKGKKELKVNGYNTLSENCFAQLGNYRDSKKYGDFIKITNSDDVSYIYKTLLGMHSPLAKKYLRENKEIKKYKKTLKEIVGTWKGNKTGCDFYITISNSMVNCKRYYDHKPCWGIVDPRAGELRDSGKYRLKYSSELGWYYVKYGKKLTISKSQNMLKFQFYDVWKETIKMHQ